MRLRAYSTNHEMCQPFAHAPAPPRPLLLQTNSFDMDRSAARDSRRTAGRVADKEAREEKAASERARREAARLAVAGGTSALGGSGGGGGGVSGNTGDAVRQVGAVGAGAAGSPLVFLAHMARRTRPRGRAPRSLDDRDRRRAVSATRRVKRSNIQWVCGANDVHATKLTICCALIHFTYENQCEN